MAESVPSSHGSLHGEDLHGGSDSGFDSEEYKEFLKFKRRAKRRLSATDEEDDRETDQRGNSGPAPEWDGQSIPFQDWLVKARLWLATTKAKKRAQGPMLLQKPSGGPFQAFKHWSKDTAWLSDEMGGHTLLDAMDRPEHYGEDKEEDLLASLSKITYHLRRGKDEKSRDFFARWDEALRKVDEHQVKLPDKFLGFLMVNALGLGDQDIKTLLSFTRGSIGTADIREFIRKHEMKLHSRDVGAERRGTTTRTSTSSIHHIQEVPDNEIEDDYEEVEQALEELQGDDGDDEHGDEEWAIDEHEAAEILATMLNNHNQQKKTFTQSWKLKKAKELARGFSNWKKDGKGHQKGKGKGSLSDIKAITKCAICGKVGHWHRECPEKGTTKDKHADRAPREVHLMQTGVDDFEEAYFCGYLDSENIVQSDDIEKCNKREENSMETEGTQVLEDTEAQQKEEDEVTKQQSAKDIEQHEDIKQHETDLEELGLLPGQELLSCAETSEDVAKTPHERHFAEVGHDTNAFCQYKDRLTNLVQVPEHEVYWNEKTFHETVDEACATIDTGCQRMAIGRETLDRLVRHLPEALPVLQIRQENRFRSVHGLSSTEHVAAIPSSLGHRGCILRPAIFEQECSRKAPFLISLPFLLHCRAILHLDPQSRLRVHFRRYRFTADCHIGPSGALRIPLTQFDKAKIDQLRRAHDDFQHQQEFEVYRTESPSPTHRTEISPAAVSPERGDKDTIETPPGLGHGNAYGYPRAEQEGATNEQVGGGEIDSGVGQNRSQGPLHHDAGHGTGHPIDQEQGRRAGDASRDPAVQRLSYDEDSTWDTIRDSISTVRVGDRRGGTDAIAGIEHREDNGGSRTITNGECFESTASSGTQHRYPERGDVGRTSSMSTRNTLQALSMQEGVLQPRTSDVAVSTTYRKPVQDLHLAGVSTSMDTTNGNPGEPGHAIHELREHAGSAERETGNLSSQERDTPRIKRVSATREVQGLWDDTTNREERQPVTHAGESSGGGDRLASRGATRSNGDSGVRTVPQVEGHEGEAEQEQVRRDIMQGGNIQHHSEHLWRQATAALKVAEAMWQEIISLLGENAPDEVGLIHLVQAKRQQHNGEGKGRPLRVFSNISGIHEERLKTVAEVFNPNRFGPEAKKNHLIPGTAFDLQLGVNLLDPKIKQEVSKYFDVVQPGLTIISPPCTMFSILQNLNSRHYHDPQGLKRYRRAVHEARSLLRFGVMIAEKVVAYGGTFVFEHPVTSKAWALPELQGLLRREQVQLARSDQCQFGLKLPSGRLLKKPTGWATNSRRIQEALERRCVGDHEHQLVLGSDKGTSISRIAQEYPPELVKTILKQYRKDIKDHAREITMMHVEDIAGDIDHAEHYHYLAEYLNEEKTGKEMEVLANELDVDEEIDNSGENQHRRYLPRERPFSLPALIRRAHEGLGHPGNERLARILKGARASPEAIKMAKEYKCSICEQSQRVRTARSAAPPRELQVNSIVGVDTIYLPGWDEKRRMALNIVCWASRFQMIIPLQNHTPGEARRAFLQWTRFFGPPDKIYSDLGREFRGAFEFGAEIDSTYIEPGSLEMPTQRSITERAGKSFKEVFTKTLMSYACTNKEEWTELVDITNLTMNRLINKSGYSPIQRVLGYTPRIPGSNFGGGHNDHATVSHYKMGNVQVQRANRMRLAASKAYFEADCDQALQAALHSGHRSVREFEPGQTVYFWRKGTDRVKKDEPKYWRGPARVILASPPNSIWVTFKGIVIKAAPEQLRHATLDEQFTLTAWIDDIAQTREELERTPRQGYIDLTVEEHPGEEELPDYDYIEEKEYVPKHRITGKTTVPSDKEALQSVDVWEVLDSRRLLRRLHAVPRRSLFVPTEAEEPPVSIDSLSSERHTVATGFETGAIKEHYDDWKDESAEREELLGGEAWTGYTEFTIRETTSEEAPLPLTSGTGGVGLVGEIERDHLPHEPTREDKDEIEKVDEDVIHDDEGDDEDMESVRVREDKRPLEETTSQEDPGSPTKRTRVEWAEVLFNTVEEMMEAKKKKVEIIFKNLPDTKKDTFRVAIKKEIDNNIETRAYKPLTLEESAKVRQQHAEKILQSRYVLVEKNIEAEDVEKAKKDKILLREDGERSTKAKARHVMKGFSEWGAEEFDAATPQVSRESMMMVLQVLCSKAWTPGYLDFTQAFHSGDAITRELYAEQPIEGVPGMHPKQLLKLMKCCYGLLDGPYAWFVHLQKLLVEDLGYEVSRADPCLFYLFDADRRLKGIIGAATDDLLHGGDEEHWNKMKVIQTRYKLGKFGKGDGRFSGKEIKCVDGGIKVFQQMYTQDKVQPIPVRKERKAEKMAYCTDDEVHLLRGLLGTLAWLAKESRPDLSGRVAILQQSMPKPYVQDLLEANALAREALEDTEIGVILRPVPLEHLRVGTITDASWGNARQEGLEAHSLDFWEERADRWIRHHVVPRKLKFHPGAVDDGPDLTRITESRLTETKDGQLVQDNWNDEVTYLRSSPWTGTTEFMKCEPARKSKTSEKFLQRCRTSSQAGYLVFFYDDRMEETEDTFPVSIIQWKSYRLKRNTVNTLSAECQALVAGIGEIHWQRFLLLEVLGYRPVLQDWESLMQKIPFTAVTDSKSLYDTITTTTNAATHIEDKRTAIDVTILKADFKRTRGRIRWIPGEFMLADSLTKKMNAQGLKRLLVHGKWSLNKAGCQHLRDNQLLLLA